MKKIAIISANHFLPVPPIYGGACEELMKMLIDENEKNKKADIVYIQKKFDKSTMQQLKKFDFKNTEMIYINNNKIIDFFIKAINFGLKIIKVKKRLPTTYETNLLKFCKRQGFDKIVFEAGSPPNIKKYTKYYSKEQIYKHFHSQYPESDKTDLSQSIGNIIGVSEFIVNDWMDWYERNNIKNVTGYVLKNCVDESKFGKVVKAHEKNEIRKSFGFKDDDFVIVFVGRLIEEKGIRELIEAISQLSQNIKLLIVGSPNFKDKSKSPFLTELYNLTEKFSDKIKFTGFVENKNLYKYYQSADLQCVPSTWNDPAPLVVFEGILCGVPQLVTRSGGIPEYVCKEGSIVINKDENLVENLKKNILELSKDKEKLEKMRKANLEYSKIYKKENYLRDFIEIIESK